MPKTLLAILASFILVIPLSVNADAVNHKVRINTASVQELDKYLEGVGPRIAEEIVAYRTDNGSFKSFADLDRVKYVGQTLIDKNKDRISFE